MKKYIFLLAFCLFAAGLISAPVHTSYLWHMQQPIYWPDKSVEDSIKYQKCWESYWLKQNNGNWYDDGLQHPLSDLQDIFGKSDRVAAYQYRPHNSVQTLLGLPDAGAQVNYSGCLMENVNSLAAESAWGYNQNWQDDFIQARNWQTSGGNPRMDITAFSFHHALAPLIDEASLHKEIQAHRYIYEQNFGSDPFYSKGYWPAECSFSERIIQTLVEEGLEWSVVANSHLARTCQDYPLSYGTGGCNIDSPNKSDVVGPVGENWWSGQIDGRGGTFCAPFSYQAHKAKYVDPETGQEYKIEVVPMGDLLSYMNGFGTMGTGEIDSNIAPHNDPVHPSIILMAHDGDNAWGGGYDYYLNSVPSFANAAANQGYIPSTVQQFLDDNPVPDNDIVHVEDGSWVNAANDWGHPQFINWLWPMYTGNYQFNPTGWTEDARNWAVITAAQNRVETAEEMSSGVAIENIVNPDNDSNNAELAWHYFLPSLTSGYMYYGTAQDMEVKQTIACNNAVFYADQEINFDQKNDNTAPTILIPQRFPYNPGSAGFGPIYGYEEHINDANFYVWTFAYDVSGLASVELKYRLDYDDENPIASNENETYTGGSGVSDWISISMTERDFPAGNVTGNPSLDFFVMPQYIAKEYYAEITGYQDTLIDYYVEAIDTEGNVEKSPIQHLFVGNNSGGGAGDYVTWEPGEPQVGDTLTIQYRGDGPLYDVDELNIHIGVNSWQNVNDYIMEFHAQDTLWQYEFPLTVGVDVVDFCFHDGEGNWDNNAGQDWHVEVTGGTANSFNIDGELDDTAELVASCNDIELWSDQEEGFIYVACTPAADSTDVFILFSNTLDQYTGAPWAKSGDVPVWELFLANEGSNGYNDWFDNNSTAESALGNVLEGYFNIEQELGVVDSFYLALGEYQTPDVGNLIGQLPAGNGDENINFNEYACLEVEEFAIDPSGTDGNFNIQVFPNPFHDEVKIKFKKKNNYHPNSARLKIYNIKGELVRTLTPAEFSTAAAEFDWFGKDDYGREVGSGLYFYKLANKDFRGKIIYLP